MIMELLVIGRLANWRMGKVAPNGMSEEFLTLCLIFWLLSGIPSSSTRW